MAIMQSIEWLTIAGLVVLALWGMASLHASLMASGRTEQAQERLEQETAAWNAALDEMDATLLPERTIADLAEQVAQLELRLRALELERTP